MLACDFDLCTFLGMLAMCLNPQIGLKRAWSEKTDLTFCLDFFNLVMALTVVFPRELGLASLHMYM